MTTDHCLKPQRYKSEVSTEEIRIVFQVQQAITTRTPLQTTLTLWQQLVGRLSVRISTDPMEVSIPYDARFSLNTLILQSYYIVLVEVFIGHWLT